MCADRATREVLAIGRPPAIPRAEDRLSCTQTKQIAHSHNDIQKQTSVITAAFQANLTMRREAGGGRECSLQGCPKIAG